MAFSDSQPKVSLIAGATFASSDLYKFVSVDGSGHAVVGPTTASGAVGTLLSVTATTGGAGSEVVAVGQLAGIGKVRMAGSTLSAGYTIAGSSNGLGIAPTTDQAAIGTIVSGSSGTTGRIASVMFHKSANV